MASARGPQSDFSSLPIGAKVFILVALLTVVTAGYYAVFYMDVKERTEAAINKRVDLQANLSKAQQRQKEFLARREEVVGREALDRQHLRILPDKSEIPAFLDDMNRLAELSGLSMSKVTPMPHQSEKFFVKVPVNLAITGKYHQLAKFFYNISRLERAINMEDISMGSPKDIGGEMVLEVSVKATTFRRAPGATEGKKKKKKNKKGKKG